MTLPSPDQDSSDRFQFGVFLFAESSCLASYLDRTFTHVSDWSVPVDEKELLQSTNLYLYMEIVWSTAPLAFSPLSRISKCIHN